MPPFTLIAAMDRPLLLLTAILFVACATRIWLLRKRRLPLPPGPKKLPLLGNLFDIPRTHGMQVYHQWGQDYQSDILHVDAAGQSMVILNSYDAALDLLERRSSVYSSRTSPTMAGELMGWGEWNLGLLPYGEAWRTRRRLIHRTVHAGVAKNFHPQQLRISRQLLQHLLEEPEQFQHHIEFATTKFILSVAYGLEISSHDDPLLALIKQVNEVAVMAVSPGRFLVDLIPWLKYVPEWLPGTQFKRDARLWKQWSDAMVNRPFEAAKAHIATGQAGPSFVSFNLGEKDEEKAVADVAAVMYTAATDTTATALQTFILATTLFPEVQCRAQEELDRVLQPGQLPSFDDFENLPYIRAVMLEILRWNPPLPSGVPHTSEMEDLYRGYRIPNNTVVMSNLWAMTRNSAVYPEPEKFNPSRFIKNGRFDAGSQDPMKIVFGFGRRICPGRHTAASAIWATIASMLRVFEIRPIPGHVPTGAFKEDSITRAPLPFKCSIKPRSTIALEMINNATLHD